MLNLSDPAFMITACMIICLAALYGDWITKQAAYAQRLQGIAVLSW